MSLIRTKLSTKRSRKLKTKDLHKFREVNTCVLVKNNEVLDTIGTKTKQTIAKIDSSVRKDYLFPMLYDLKYIEDYAWKGFPEQRKLAEKDKQDWIDDLYLKSLGIIYTNYVSSKYGFDRINKETGELIPGKSLLNKVIKRLHTISGTRINFLSEKLVLKGVQHYSQKGKNKFNYDRDVEQFNLVKQLPRNSVERKLYVPSSWIEYLVNDIIAIESKYIKINKNGKEYVNKKEVKKELLNLLKYSRYRNHEEKLMEIISNFKTDVKEPLRLKM